MKKKLTYILLLVSILGFGQKNDMLIGFQNLKCENTIRNEKLKVRERISKIKIIDNNITEIEIIVNDNCIFEKSNGRIKIIADTLFLIYSNSDTTYKINNNITEIEISETYLDCNRFFCFKYLIKDLTEEIKNFKANNKDIYFSTEPYITIPETFTLNGIDTINRTDKYGFKQGLFLIYNEKGLLSDSLIYKSDTIRNGRKFINYYKNGRKKSFIDISNGEFKYKEFYKSGYIKKECLLKEGHFAPDLSKCRDYDDK